MILIQIQEIFTRSKSTLETFEKGVTKTNSFMCQSGIFIVNLKHVSHLFLVFIDFEQVNICWRRTIELCNKFSIRNIIFSWIISFFPRSKA